MKTSSWATYKGEGRIGISAGTPRGAPAGYRIYKALAPSREWMNAPMRVYVTNYRAQLQALDARKVWDTLHSLQANAEPVLLCWERPVFNEKNWCHRRLVAKYFEDELGEKVDELGYEGGYVDYEPLMAMFGQRDLITA